MSEEQESALEKLLSLTEVSKDVYRNNEQAISRSPSKKKAVFGGTLVAQSLLAASKTISTDFRPFSMNCNFLVGGVIGTPIFYKVKRTRDGKNYATRQVEALQKDRVVFICTVSYQAKVLKGSSANLGKQLFHQPAPPRYMPSPEEMVPSDEGLTQWLSMDHVRPHVRNMEEVVMSSDLDPCDWRIPSDFFRGDTATATERNIPIEHRDIKYWFRAKPKIKDPNFHDVALAYCSDAYFLSCTTRLSFRNFGSFVFSVSLDHTIYFHKEFKADDWLLYVVNNPKTGQNRSLVTGQIFNQAGDLVATTIQEGLAIIDGKNDFGELAKTKNSSKL